MILHKDGLTELTYDVATDILTVRWLDSKSSSEPELQYSIGNLLEVIRNYDIRKLLIDAREDVEGVTDEEFVEMNVNFAKLLANTRLHKVARMGTTNANRENFIQTLADDVLALPGTSLQYQSFKDEWTALQWLQQE